MTLLYFSFQKMCKQFANILSIRSDKDRHLRFPVFRASAQGGDRYPKHGTDQSDRVLPQNRRRPGRIGQAGIRCPRIRSNPANQISELPHKPKIGASGCGHRNSKRKKQGADLSDGPNLASFLCSPLKVPLPAFYTDNFSSTLPFLQAPNRDPHFSCKRFLSHAIGFPICPDADSLSIIKEMIGSIQEVCYRDTVELRQPIYFFRFNVLCKAFLDGLVDTVGHTHLVCHFHLHQPFAVSAPTEPVRYIIDLLISAIPLIKLGGLQNFTRGAQNETMYE